MQGYSPKIPLTKDNIDGFLTNKTALETIKQDLKMLLLTNPGERIMLPTYGVGLRKILFEQKGSATNGILANNIRMQISKYMDFVSIQNIEVNDSLDQENSIYVRLTYYIPSINATEQLDLALATN